MKYWVTSDFHINHLNILKYCGRTEFMTKSDLDEYNKVLNLDEEEQHKLILSKESLVNMNEVLVRNHNERVKDEDIVLYLGDFCFRNTKGGKYGEGEQEKPLEILKRFKGRFVFIAGNHDSNNALKTPIISCKIRYANKIINCVHNPEHVDMDCSINFVGHIHGHWKFKRIIRGGKITDAINVGVDVHNFYPKTIEEILVEYKRWFKENNYK